ncbi:hypothetical protein BH23VER1_BH23VER1_25960 [soil metagenome]
MSDWDDAAPGDAEGAPGDGWLDDRLADVDRAIRRRRAEEGGAAADYFAGEEEADAGDPFAAAPFSDPDPRPDDPSIYSTLDYLRALEDAPETTLLEELSARGEDFPPLGEIQDESLCARLWHLIRCLARMRVFLHWTDHLSDRNLYAALVERRLREPVLQIPLDDRSALQIDMAECDSNDEQDPFLRYYATPEDRATWQEEDPATPLPPHADPPFDRDRHLPVAFPES